MFAEIIVISPDKEVTKLVKKIQDELNVNVTIIENSFWDAVREVQKIVSRKPDCIRVLASGGSSLMLLQQHFPTAHFVDTYPTEYDIVLALDKAKTLKKELGLLLAASKNLEVIEKLSSILGLKVKVYVYRNWQDVEVGTAQALQDGCEVILGVGNKIENLVKQLELKFIPVMIGESTLRNALEWAKNILQAEKREKLTIEQMNAISMYAHEGIIMINEEKVVTVCNPVASKMLGLIDEDMIGWSLTDFIDRLNLVDIFEDFEKKLGYIHQGPNGSLLVNKFPIVGENGLRGVLLTLIDITKKHEENKNGKSTYIKGLVARYCFDDIIHVNSGMSAVIKRAKKYANTECTVLIRGESGTGKEVLAQSIHNGHSDRWNGPFVAINCATLDDQLSKSELFGYSEGSFTGASKGGKPGLFEFANGGTLFFDEIGKMKLEQQSHILRVLQEKEVRPIGSNKVIPVDVRVIAASNEDLEDLVKRGHFREDLYYRLNMLDLFIPPLRERREDISVQAVFFLKKFSRKYGKSIYKLSPSVLDDLSNMDWPGNTRQLEYFIEKCVVLADNEDDASIILANLIKEAFAKNMFLVKNGCVPGEDQITIKVGKLTEMNTEIIHKISSTAANLTTGELALKLGISAPTLRRYLKQN